MQPNLERLGVILGMLTLMITKHGLIIHIVKVRTIWGAYMAFKGVHGSVPMAVI